MNKKNCIVLFSIFFIYLNLHANAGVPMIAIVFPEMILSLVPVILIEIAVLIKRLKINKQKTVLAVVAGNLYSTLFGISLTWIILVVIQVITGGDRGIYNIGILLRNILSVTWQAPWLMPSNDLHWQIPAAALFLLIPFFFASWLMETWLEMIILKKEISDKKYFKRSVFFANLFSYLFLAAASVVFLIWNRNTRYFT